MSERPIKPSSLDSEDHYPSLHTSSPCHTAKQQLLCVQILTGNGLPILPSAQAQLLEETPASTQQKGKSLKTYPREARFNGASQREAAPCSTAEPNC